ncbi:MAG: C25 family cysteine peptidase [Candidatus Odinarchaeota archaeon]
MRSNKTILKIAAIVICALIITASILTVDFLMNSNLENEPEEDTLSKYIPKKPPEVKSVMTENGVWVEVAGSPEGTPSKAFVIVSDTRGITVVAEFNGFWKGEDDSIIMPGTTTMSEVGKPSLPRLITYLEVPYDVNVTHEMIYGEPIIYNGYSIPPTEKEIIPFSWDYSGNDIAAPEYDSTVYSSNAFFPSYNISITGEIGESPIILRGRRLLELSFYPMQFSPQYSLSSGRLLFYPRFIVRLLYSKPAQIEPVDARLWSEPFESLLKGFVLNYNPWNSESGTGPGAPPTPVCPSGSIPSSIAPVSADYLIVTHSSLKLQADRLAAWKTQKGLSSEVWTTARIQTEYPAPTEVESIENLIKDAYDKWTVGPSYVLFFGDCELVPNGYGMVHTSTSPAKDGYEMDPIHEVPGSSQSEYYFYHPQNGKIATDSTYVTVHGDDYFPDIFYGRISVNDITEAEVIVDKILSYEQSPTQNPEFYNNALATAYYKFFDSVNGIESGSTQFVRRAEDIRLYLQDEFGYTVHLNYSANTTRGIPAEFHDGIVFSGTRYDHLDHIDWIMPVDSAAGAGNISLNIDSDEGRFLVLYHNHGDSMNMVYPFRISPTSEWNRSEFEGWCAPMFNSSVLPGLSNGDQLPLVISVGCNMGWFDGEIDELQFQYPDNRYDANFECFSENITRMAGGGAIAAIGATRITSSLCNGDLLDGIIQAFWPGFLSNWQNQPIYGMSAALQFGKLNTALNWGYEDSEEMYTRKTFEAYHLFGDPETQLWTAAPSELTVSYPTQLSTYGVQKFVVTVLNQSVPVSFAKICIQAEDVYKVGYTNNYGQAIFEIDISSTEPMNVTVTKHNFIPHIGSIEVYDCAATFTTYPEQGIAGDTPQFVVTGFTNSPIELYYNETHLGTFSGNSISPTIPLGRNGYANIKANATNEVAIVLFNRYQGGPPVDPYVYSQQDRSTWHLAGGSLTYNNPSIEIYENGVYKNSWDLIQTHDYEVRVNVSNNLNQPIYNTEITLAWAMFSVGREWHQIDADRSTPLIIDSYTIPEIPALGWELAIIPWLPTQSGHICLNTTVFHPNDMNLKNNVGQENTDVARLQSPGKSWFLVGNPTDKSASVYLEVRQQCSIDDIWGAEIMGLSYQEILPGDFENISLEVTSPPGTNGGEKRLFIVSLYIDGIYYGGLQVLGLQMNSPTTDDGITLLMLVAGAIGAVIVIVGVIFMHRRKRS